MITAIKAVLLFGMRWRRVSPGDYLVDENHNYLTDESGNKLIG